MFGLQKNYPVAATLAQLWQTLKTDLIGRARILEKNLGNGLNNGNFRSFWDAISIKIIGYLIVILMSLLFAIVGYNFANDDQFHNYNRMMVERMQVEKASKEDLKCEGEKIRAEIAALQNSLKVETEEIKKILMRKYYPEERRGRDEQ